MEPDKEVPPSYVDKWWLQLDPVPEGTHIHDKFPYWQPTVDLNMHVTGHMDCIIEDFLYLGDLESATEESLFLHDIWYCVSLLGEHSFCHAPSHLNRDDEHLMLAMSDDPRQSLLSIVPKTTSFLKKVKEAEGKVLVHCSAGISRSTTIVLAYLIQECDMSLEDAYKYVKDRRPVVCPNMGFMNQLHQIDASKRKTT